MKIGITASRFERKLSLRVIGREVTAQSNCNYLLPDFKNDIGSGDGLIDHQEGKMVL